ncbi:DUF1569 domain-containing protein [Polaribacter litorisediminis]|uniref:DUF1569 domain-containing protein n=1 Tax=Polaribacter litorisediminis TaxID=1908341 RepID=UPI001CBB8E79|nr:DUF1569 domain-containing protein [Polaribacter litorisediminis]UAM98723.1 DUF1569 domain-containing protein [Polaribacter litorisediminis]
MLDKEFSAIQHYISLKDKENTSVSKGNVAWHLDHSLKVINSVCTTFKASKESEYKRQFNATRLLIFALGFFPRGKVKAPKQVTPPTIIEKKDLKNQLNEAIKNIEVIKNLHPHQNFVHPIFKQLDRNQTLKFLKLHTTHHLKIIKDILN